MEQVPTEFREEEIEMINLESLLQYLEILVKGRYLIIAIFSVITFSTLLYVLITPPTYVAASKGVGHKRTLKLKRRFSGFQYVFSFHT